MILNYSIIIFPNRFFSTNLNLLVLAFPLWIYDKLSFKIPNEFLALPSIHLNPIQTINSN